MHIQPDLIQEINFKSLIKIYKIMETILFDKNGEQLKICFKVKNGVISAAYTIELFDNGSNVPIITYSGDNTNSSDDCFPLPLPLAVYNGRLIQLTVNFKGLDLAMSKKYSIGFEVCQGEVLIGSVFEEGDLSSGEQSVTIFAELKGS
jgi:hypothetical protein